MVNHIALVVDLLLLWGLAILVLQHGVAHGDLRLILVLHLLGIYHDLHLRLLEDAVSLFDSALPVDLASLLVDTGLVVVNIDVHDVVLVELLRPPLRDAVLHFVLQDLFIWAFRQGLSNRLLMELKELVVELGNHLLVLLILVELVDNSLLNILFSITRDHIASWSDNQLRLDLRSDRLLSQDLLDVGILILLEQINVPAADVVHDVLIDLSDRRSRRNGERGSVLNIHVLRAHAHHLLELAVGRVALHILVRVGSTLDDVSILRDLRRQLDRHLVDVDHWLVHSLVHILNWVGLALAVEGVHWLPRHCRRLLLLRWLYLYLGLGWVKCRLSILRILFDSDLRLVMTRGVSVLVEHKLLWHKFEFLQELYLGDTVLSSSDRIDLLSKDGHLDMILDQVRAVVHFDQLCKFVSISKLPNETLCDRFLSFSLGVNWVFSLYVGLREPRGQEILVDEQVWWLESSLALT